jgi:phosphohistidine phosphatase
MMETDVYLVRHAKAEQGPDDFVRRLTKGGRDAADRVAQVLQSKGVQPERIEFSPLIRAAQTAEIIAKRTKGSLIEAPDLQPGRDVETVRERLTANRAGPLILVGHNPFMEQLAALLIAEDPDRYVLTFHTASVAKLIPLAGSQGRRFACDWLITPSLFPR